MYGGLRDAKGRMLFNRAGNDNVKGSYPIQSSFFDKYILCYQCESKLSKLERYAAGVLYGGLNPEKNPIQFSNPIPNDDFVSIFVRGFDYVKLKLFFLSILWRAHISINPFFREVILEDIVEFELRQMVAKDEAGNFDKYPVTVYGLRWDAERLLRVIAEPNVIKNERVESVSFLINGFLYQIGVVPSVEKTNPELYLSPLKDLEIRVIQPPLTKRLFISYLKG